MKEQGGARCERSAVYGVTSGSALSSAHRRSLFLQSSALAHVMPPRVASLSARCAKSIAEQIRKLDRPVSAVIWLANGSRPQDVAAALEGVAPCIVGSSVQTGLVGGGSEYFSPASDGRVSALAISLPDDAVATAFHSRTDGLPDFDPSTWEEFASAGPSESPNLLLLASPPRDASFPLESWLGRLDSTLPWASKVGGVVGGGDGRLYVGTDEHDGGAVGLALSGSVQLDALVCQGAIPIGPSYQVTHVEAGSLIRELDGGPVAAALQPALDEWRASGGRGALMAGISVDGAAKAKLSTGTTLAPLPGASHEASYVVRQIMGYYPNESALAIGASSGLLEAPGAVRLQLHAYSADNARSELRARAAALHAESPAPHAGGLMISCAGRGEALYGEAGVETAVLREELGGACALGGWFANGEIGPVGRRSVVHTFTTTVALLRGRG